MVERVLLVGLQPGATVAQLHETRALLEGELPGYRIVVVAGMAGGPTVVEVKRQQPCTVAFSIW